MGYIALEGVVTQLTVAFYCRKQENKHSDQALQRLANKLFCACVNARFPVVSCSPDDPGGKTKKVAMYKYLSSPELKNVAYRDPRKFLPT